MKYPYLITPVVLALCGTAWADESQQIAMTESPDSGLYDLFGRRIERATQNVDGSMPEGALEIVTPPMLRKTSPEIPKVESGKASPSKAIVATPVKTATPTLIAAATVSKPKTPVTSTAAKPRPTIAATTTVKPKTAPAPAPKIAATANTTIPAKIGPPVVPAPKIPANAHAISWTQRYYTDVNSGTTGATHVVKSGDRVMLRSFGGQ